MAAKITEFVANLMNTKVFLSDVLLTLLVSALAIGLIICIVRDEPFVTWEEDGVTYAFTPRHGKVIVSAGK